MQRQLLDQRIEAGWERKESDALTAVAQSGKTDDYRDACVNHRVAQTLSIAHREAWSSWKTRAVCKYVGKVVQNMAIVELSTFSDQAASELIEHASEGFDSHAARRAARV